MQVMHLSSCMWIKRHVNLSENKRTVSVRKNFKHAIAFREREGILKYEPRSKL